MSFSLHKRKVKGPKVITACNKSPKSVSATTTSNVIYFVDSTDPSAFPTIQNAINAAVAEGASNIHQKIVTIKAGIYHEDIYLVNGINLLGAPPHQGGIIPEDAVHELDQRLVKIVGNVFVSVLPDSSQDIVVKMANLQIEGCFNLTDLNKFIVTYFDNILITDIVLNTVAQSAMAIANNLTVQQVISLKGGSCLIAFDSSITDMLIDTSSTFYGFRIANLVTGCINVCANSRLVLKESVMGSALVNCFGPNSTIEITDYQDVSVTLNDDSGKSVIGLDRCTGSIGLVNTTGKGQHVCKLTHCTLGADALIQTNSATDSISLSNSTIANNLPIEMLDGQLNVLFSQFQPTTKIVMSAGKLIVSHSYFNNATIDLGDAVNTTVKNCTVEMPADTVWISNQSQIVSGGNIVSGGGVAFSNTNLVTSIQPV